MPRRIAWRLALLGALVPATLVAVPPAAEAATVVPGAIFNDPSGTTAEQNRIRDYVVGLVNATTSGAEIRVSEYTFTDSTVSTALISAKQRGVGVKVIIDGDNLDLSQEPNSQYPALRQGLGEDRSQPSWLLACPPDRACIADRDLRGNGVKGINHDKYFLFSDVGGASDIVVQTSANMTTPQRTGYFNNAVTIQDAGIYDSYRAYFDDQAAYGAAPTGRGDYYTTFTSGPYKTYFFPRQETPGTRYDNDPGTDTVKLILDNVACTGGTQIRVAMYIFDRTQIASKLVALKNAGCSVYLAADGHGGNLSGAVTDILYGKLTQRVECDDGPTGIGVHSKYLLINGVYDGTPGKKLVFTGSHNYSYAALRANDEALLKIDNSAIYDQYKANHDRLMSYCAGS